MNRKSYLSHHGVEGQKWGVRNGPPYPIDRSKKRNVSVSGLFLKRSKSQNQQEKVFANKMKDINFDTEIHDGPYEQLSNLKKKLLTDDTIFEDMEVVNEGHSSIYKQLNNCVYCTFALEMRIRGYDVQARGAERGIDSNAIASFFKGGKMIWPNRDDVDWKNRSKTMSKDRYDKEAMNNVLDSIRSDGNDTRGLFCIKYKDIQSGHAILYTSKDGDIRFYDAQSNKERSIKDLISLSNPDQYSYIRLDNLEPNDNITELIISRTKNRW